MKRSYCRTRGQYQFSDREDAKTHLIKEGFDCIGGFWMRGRNEYATIEDVGDVVLVSIGKRYF